MHGMSSAASRRSAAETARKQGSGLAMDPDADGPGVRGWLDGISAGHGLATAFDTRLSGIRRSPAALAGVSPGCLGAAATGCSSLRKASW